MKKLKILVLVCVLLVVFSACLKQENVQTVNDNAETTVSVTDVGEQTTETQDTTVISSVPEKHNTTQEKVPGVTEITSVTQSPQVNTPATKNVSLSINCLNAINYGILNVGTFGDVLPSDGNILPVTTIEISDGESAMKVIKRALKANSITYSIDSGGYIKKINGLGEFDCGQQSGWLYRVNGITPSVSCKNYVLKDWDRIEIIYTCNLGNDI